MIEIKEILKNKIKLVVILVATILLIALCLFFKQSIPSSNKQQEETIVEDIKVEIVEENNLLEYKEEYEKNHQINDEYMGRLVFNSGLIDQYFCQTDNNTFYLNHTYDKSSFHEGAAFVDYRNDFDNDQNVIIYGHNVAKRIDSSQTHMFTPLHQLENKENYEENKELILYLNNRKETYLICYVYVCDIIEEDGVQYLPEDEPLYDNTSYTQIELDEYLAKIEEREFYKTGEKLTTNDRILTLQTCYENKPDKLIVVCKRTSVEYYE